jgi:glycosyltransferase involved in cell wall biosynthesis
MKVAVNIHCLHPPLTGIGHYARHLIQALLDDASVESVVGVSHAGWHEREELAALVEHSRGFELEPQGGVASAGATAFLLGLGKRVLRPVPGLGRMRARLNFLLKKRETASYSDHIYWEPNYLLLPLSNVAVTTVHDLSHVRHPEFHPAQRLQELARLPLSLGRARHILAVSEFTRRELADVYGLDPATISLVPPAVSSRFRPHASRQCEEVRRRYGLPEHYVLYAGTIEPRKNLERLLAAYTRLPQELQHDYPLVLSGGDGWHHQEFDAALKQADTVSVHRLGYVVAEDLPVIYSAATIFAYPSLYEGFGMPVLEAMASGTPVLTSSVASMPGLAAGAALLVDPLSVAEISAGLQQLLTDAPRRDAQRERGLQVAGGHNWAQSYRQLREALLGASS